MTQKTNMRNLIFSLLIGITLLFFITPVSAAQIINGDFLTGDLTGWTVQITNSSSTGLELCDVYPSPFKYFRGFAKRNTAGWSKVRISQEVDVTGWGGLTVRCTSAESGSGFYHRFFIDDDYTDIPTTGTWTNTTKDISSYSGVHTVGIELYINTVGYSRVYCTNIYLSDYYLCAVNYNPDIPVTNTKPFELSYILNESYSGEYCEIYSWSGIDISSNDTPNIIWLQNFEGYVTGSSGSYTTTDYFHSYGWWELNETYGVTLHTSVGKAAGCRFDEFEKCPNLLDYDQIYVNYSWNAPPPPDPTPEPTPNSTPEPTPSGTLTPGPTATPQPDPEPTNESLNTSFKEGYHILVDNTVDGYFTPVYNFTDYIAQPLTSLNHTLLNFTVEMEKSFNTTSVSLGISTSILFLIMSSFPQKLINVFAYYLIWVMILLIFKGQT